MNSLVHSDAKGVVIPTELIERLEAASVGSRELDREIMVLIGGAQQVSEAIFYGPGETVWYCGDYEDSAVDVPLPYVTTSLDAALALAERVLPGWTWDIAGPREPITGTDDGRPSAALRLDADRPSLRIGTATTPALALCIAILRAVAAQPRVDGEAL